MRSPHKSDKAVESQHVPASAAVATRGPIPTPAFGERVVGAAAIALVASLVIQNAVLVWAGAPGYGDPIEKVLAFHAENRGAVANVEWRREQAGARIRGQELRQMPNVEISQPNFLYVFILQ